MTTQAETIARHAFSLNPNDARRFEACVAEVMQKCAKHEGHAKAHPRSANFHGKTLTEKNVARKRATEQAILNAIKMLGGAATAREIAEVIPSMKPTAIGNYLSRMNVTGGVTNKRRGIWELAE